MNRPIVLDYFGNPRPPYAGPAVAPVVTERCWICYGIGSVEIGFQEFTNVGNACRCVNCGGSGYVTHEVAA